MNSKVNAVDLSAKLLATENLSVRRARTRTASFDIKSRVLTLPMWKEMSPEVEGMLVGHEVGHALYTTDEYMDPIKENPKLQGYLNVIEDVRIEKLMKRKYPGIRKTMNEGYKQLNERDFFGVAKIPDLSTLILIDRINLYFKAGFQCGVKFTPEEMAFVRRAEVTETVDDVVQLAIEVYDFSKTEVSKRLAEAQEELQETEGDGEMEDPYGMDEIDEDYGSIDDSDMDETGEESDEDGFRGGKENQATSGKSKEEIFEDTVEEQLESITDRNFYKNLEDMADENTDIIYHQLDTKFPECPIVGYKRIIEETAETMAEEESYSPEFYKKRYDDFKLDADRVVNYLIKEFEMKKSADMYKRAQTAKVGSLDMRKVWAYKLNDDLFKRVTTIPKGKNHGMIMLVDWSGSMDGVLEDTVKQVMTLAMFCQRAQIPYQVFAFTSQYADGDCESKYHAARREWYEKSDNTLSNAMFPFHLLELFSSKMSSVEFNTMVKRLTSVRAFTRSKFGQYGTGGTPLNEALSYMVEYLPKFIKNNGIQKMSFITLTDGEGGSLSTNSGRRSLEDYRHEHDSEGKYVKITQKHFIKDDLTKKNYQIDRFSGSHTEAILRMLKDRYDINSVGFYICANNRRDLYQAIKSNIPGFNGNEHMMIDVMRKFFRDDGFFSVKNSGRDDLFIIPQNRLAIENQQLEILANATAKQIANKFSKMMSSKKTSRVLLNRFISYVA